MIEDKLTPDQIKNWRRVLLTMIGSYALIMSDSEVQAIRDEMQRKASLIPVNDMCTIEPQKEVIKNHNTDGFKNSIKIRT